MAAGLGKLDAFNLFDPCWKALEYDIWYRLLNCGIRLPASTGSDWFICSNNRVYVQTEEAFTYESWLRGLQAGRTFITNGPALFLEADGESPGACLDSRSGARKLSVRVEWSSHYPLRRLEVVGNGEVAESRVLVEEADQREGVWELGVEMDGDGWLAARAYGEARDSFMQSVYAHTSPIYVGSGMPGEAKVKPAATFFARGIEEASENIRRSGRFTQDEQREEVLHLFEEGRKVYARLRTRA